MLFYVVGHLRKTGGVHAIVEMARSMRAKVDGSTVMMTGNFM